MTNYKFMIHEFMTAYQAIPGDFDSAHSFFDNGSDDICGSSYECNGDGDGMIELDSKSMKFLEVGSIYPYLVLPIQNLMANGMKPTL